MKKRRRRKTVMNRGQLIEFEDNWTSKNREEIRRGIGEKK